MAQVDTQKQREFARQVVVALRNAGYEALWAGGCVRDQLLGLVPKDYDVATSATPKEVREIFGHRRTIPVGASFGVITVLGPKEGGQVEVATFRTDGGYTDGRHPDQVQFSTPEHDAARRDFTINGLFFDPIGDEVRDYVGGQQDLESGIVRAIGDAGQRIAEDKLRMLRAIRFAARFGFAIETSTLAAIQHHAAEIVLVSGERVGAEIRAMFLHASRARAFELLRDSNLEPFVLPEVAARAGDEWTAMLDLVDRLQQPSLGMALAAVLRGVDGERVKDGIAGRWKLPNRDVDRADWLLDTLPIALAACDTAWPQLQRVLVNDGADELVRLAASIVGDHNASIRLCRSKLALPREELDPPPLITGGDLISAGFKPGPEFSTLLERIRDAQLDGRIASPEAAIELAKSLRAAD